MRRLIASSSRNPCKPLFEARRHVRDFATSGSSSSSERSSSDATQSETWQKRRNLSNELKDKFADQYTVVRGRRNTNHVSSSSSAPSSKDSSEGKARTIAHFLSSLAQTPPANVKVSSQTGENEGQEAQQQSAAANNNTLPPLIFGAFSIEDRPDIPDALPHKRYGFTFQQQQEEQRLAGVPGITSSKQRLLAHINAAPASASASSSSLVQRQGGSYAGALSSLVGSMADWTKDDLSDVFAACCESVQWQTSLLLAHAVQSSGRQMMVDHLEATIDALLVAGRRADALAYFTHHARHERLSRGCYGALLDAAGREGPAMRWAALDVHAALERHGVAYDVCLYEAAITSLAHCGALREAMALYNYMTLRDELCIPAVYDTLLPCLLLGAEQRQPERDDEGGAAAASTAARAVAGRWKAALVVTSHVLTFAPSRVPHALLRALEASQCGGLWAVALTSVLFNKNCSSCSSSSRSLVGENVPSLESDAKGNCDEQHSFDAPWKTLSFWESAMYLSSLVVRDAASSASSSPEHAASTKAASQSIVTALRCVLASQSVANKCGRKLLTDLASIHAMPRERQAAAAAAVSVGDVSNYPLPAFPSTSAFMELTQLLASQSQWMLSCTLLQMLVEATKRGAMLQMGRKDKDDSKSETAATFASLRATSALYTTHAAQLVRCVASNGQWALAIRLCADVLTRWGTVRQQLTAGSGDSTSHLGLVTQVDAPVASADALFGIAVDASLRCGRWSSAMLFLERAHQHGTSLPPHLYDAVFSLHHQRVVGSAGSRWAHTLELFVRMRRAGGTCTEQGVNKVIRTAAKDGHSSTAVKLLTLTNAISWR